MEVIEWICYHGLILPETVELTKEMAMASSYLRISDLPIVKLLIVKKLCSMMVNIFH